MVPQFAKNLHAKLSLKRKIIFWLVIALFCIIFLWKAFGALVWTIGKWAIVFGLLFFAGKFIVNKLKGFK